MPRPPSSASGPATKSRLPSRAPARRRRKSGRRSWKRAPRRRRFSARPRPAPPGARSSPPSARRGPSGALARSPGSPNSPSGAPRRSGSWATIADAPAEFARRAHALADEFAKAEAARKEAADALALGETALADADRAARQALEAMATAREQRAASEERVEGARLRGDELMHAMATELDCEPSGLAALAGVTGDGPLPGAIEVERRLDNLRQERERLGAVNLRADEELVEVLDSRDKLVAERDDLTEAIKRLRGAIHTLNQEGRERLIAAFEVVNRHFEDLFATLFEGGKAELQLVESDDPLEAGLELVAQPPGKKPQTLTLLSGGEQALTALALIFAVFLTNPAPICVLDEVDAPLDDYNVERFCDLLDAMRKRSETRFVAITHNPITMARMDRLFGVTMAERGVSQIVSVELAEAERFAEAG